MNNMMNEMKDLANKMLLEEMNEGFQFEKKKLYNYLGKNLTEMLKGYECIVAGGTITSLFCNRDINDIDIYFRTKEQLIEFLEEVWEDGKWIVTHTKKATLFRYNNRIDIQLIHFDYFSNAEEIFNTFDFTVCMGAFDFKTEKFILHKDFLKHNCQHLLKFNGDTAFPIVSALRVQKYEDKGYTISKPEYIKILLSCMNLNIDNYEDLKDQMGGMYGINYDKIFKDIIDKKEEFSLTTIIEKLSDLNLHDDYFKDPEKVPFSDLDDLIYNITDTYKRNYFKLNDEYYIVKGRQNLEEIDDSDIKDFYTQIEPSEYFDNIKLYKFVKKVNDKYYSFYDNKFEYRIGEIIIANSDKNNYGNGLYFNNLSNISESMYRSNEGSVLIEVEVKTEDFKRLNGTSIVFDKCKVIREVPKKEYEKTLY